LRACHCFACAAEAAALASLCNRSSWGVLAFSLLSGCSSSCSGRLAVCSLPQNEGRKLAPECYELPFQEASVNFALTTKVRATPMRKISHAFMVIAILGGPASLILTHQKLTQTWPQEAFSPVDVTTLVQQAYSRCSQVPQLVRPSQCDDDIESFDQCAARKNDCDPRSVYEVPRELNVSLAQQEDK
jgi:hypothetical protein